MLTLFGGGPIATLHNVHYGTFGPTSEAYLKASSDLALRGESSRSRGADSDLVGECPLEWRFGGHLRGETAPGHHQRPRRADSTAARADGVSLDRMPDESGGLEMPALLGSLAPTLLTVGTLKAPTSPPPPEAASRLRRTPGPARPWAVSFGGQPGLNYIHVIRD